MRRFSLLLLPLLLFVLLAVFLYKGLGGNPRQLDSQSTGKPFPRFSLPDLSNSAFRHDNTIFNGQITLVNVWGVWCVTCAVELPYLTQLSRDPGLRIVGLYFDQALDPEFGDLTLDDVRREVASMLGRYGNPYVFNIFDINRDTSLDLGVTGAPEHFLVDHRGEIRLHHVGDINERVWRNKIEPIYQQLMRELSIHEGSVR